MMAVLEHGFGAGAFWAWLVLALMLLAGSIGLDIVQVDELGDVSEVSEEVQKTLVPLQNFLLAESDVSLALQTSSSMRAAQTRGDEGAYVGLSHKMLLEKLVEWEDARLGMRFIMDEFMTQF